jgi:nucleoside-diphosphate-sugar epimerase
MINRIGLTGSTGSLGKVILKNNKNINFKCFKGDITNRFQVFDWIRKNDIDVILHLAAIVPIKEVNRNKVKAKKVNFNGTKNIVDACIEKKIRWFFFSSTSHVYKSSHKKISENSFKKPVSYYGQTKLLAENYIKNKFKFTKINYCIGRIFSTTNKNQKKNYLVPDLNYKIRKTKKSLVLKNLNHYRDFISMEDISKIIFVLMKKKYNGILNLGSGKGILLKDIALVIAKRYRKKIIFMDNKKITYLVASINKLLKNYKLKKPKKIENLIF